jgi:protein-S-isoprenylcysteine O-methyltransferase Ste14
MKYAKIGIVFGVPIVLLILFALFVSNSTSNLIAFFALLLSVVFIIISLWILCWILEKD